MTVINSELAKSTGLNGRVKGDLVTVTLQPGLNGDVTDKQMAMLRDNSAFVDLCESNKMSIVEHTDGDEPSEPGNIEDIDITSMSVSKARIVIESAATLDLLDKFMDQEEAEESRKGIFEAVEKQRKEVERIIELQNKSNASG